MTACLIRWFSQGKGSKRAAKKENKRLRKNKDMEEKKKLAPQLWVFLAYKAAGFHVS